MKFYGLWSPKDDDEKITQCLVTGIWYRGECPDIEYEINKISQIPIGSDVFLYQAIEDIQLINTPFAKLLPKNEYNLDHTTVKAKCHSIGKVLAVNPDDLSVTVDWDKNYTGSEWLTYFRQDGVWVVHKNQNIAKELEKIIFKQQTQDYQVLIDGYFTKYKKAIGILEIHQKVFKIYLNHRDKNPGFTFYLRKKNDSKGRLKAGYFFQGNDSYVFTSPYKFADDNNKTQQIGFVVYLSGYSEIQIPLLHGKNKEFELFFQSVVEYFDIKYKKWNHRYTKELCKENSNSTWIERLEAFLEKDIPKINEIAKNHNIPNEQLFFSKEEFTQRLDKIKNIQNEALFPTLRAYSDNQHTSPLNQILYGPPGTGKTYSTVGMALEILEATEEQKQSINGIGKLKETFGSQVEFVTFHQSFSYEDFVEGLKAKTYNGKLSYEIENGVFKTICENAKTNLENSQNTAKK